MTLSIILNFKTRTLSSILTLFLAFNCFSVEAQIQVGDTAPEIRLPDSLGKWTKLSDIKADIVLVDFWAAWRAPCIITAKELKKIKKEFKGKSFEIFALSLDRDYWNWVNMVRKLDLPFIHVNDAYGLKSPRCKAYNVVSIPKKFLIKNGKIIAINPSFNQIREILKTN